MTHDDLVIRYSVRTRSEVLRHRSIRYAIGLFVILAVMTAPSPIRHHLWHHHPAVATPVIVYVHDGDAAKPADWWADKINSVSIPRDLRL